MVSGTGARKAGNRGPPTDPMQGADQVGGRRQLMFKLRALRAPMYNAKTGKKCWEFYIVPGRIYTFGRSRSCCDVVFLDLRVSRQHCRVYLDPFAKQLCLLEGAPPVASNQNLGIDGQGPSVLDLKRLNWCDTNQSVDTILTTTVSSHLKIAEQHSQVWNDQREGARAVVNRKVRKFGSFVEDVAEPLRGGPTILKGQIAATSIAHEEQVRNARSVFRKYEMKTRLLDVLEERLKRGNPHSLARQEPAVHIAQGLQGLERRSNFQNNLQCEVLSVKLSAKKKPCLNGVFVNGEKLAQGGHRILNPGSEVSLVACTKGGQAVNPGFGEAVGFLVEVDCSQRSPSCRLYSAKVNVRTLSEKSDISRKKRLLTDLSDERCGYDISDASGAPAKFCRVTTQVQSATLANSSPLDGQQPGFMIQKPVTKSSHQMSSRRSTEARSANVALKQTLNLPKRKLKQEVRKKTITQRLQKSQSLRLQAKSEGIVSTAVTNGQAVWRDAFSSGGSIELPVKESSKLTSSTSMLSRKQLSDSTCRFLSASDCTRKLRSVKADRTASNSRTTLTDAIEAALGESLGEEVQEQPSFNQVGEQEDVPHGLFSSAATSDENALEAFFGAESQKMLVGCKQGMQTVEDENNVVTFRRRQSYLSTAMAGKGPMTELSGLLRQGAPAAADVRTVDESGKILPGMRNDSDNMDLSKECKTYSRPDPKSQEKSSGCLVMDGGAVAPALERMSLVVPTSDGPSRVPATQDTNELEDGYLNGGGDIISSAGNLLDEACSRRAVEDSGTFKVGRKLSGWVQDSISKVEDEVWNRRSSGSGFLLNRLKDMEPDSQVYSEETISLEDLLAPADDLVGLFVATFTSDILWFLSSHNVSPDLPVTVACHDHDRCWSTAEESRSSSPFPTWPNVTVVYPPFPDSCCFSTEKRQGIGCHHPKIFLLPRPKSIRVIITSANLTRKQWLHVTNSVWWQDFPRRDSCDYETLFCTSGIDESGLNPNQRESDFAVHLSSFVASLVTDVPSAAHWALDLAEFDFSSAAASLVTSIPGLYGCPCPPVPRSIWDVVKNDIVIAENGIQRRRKFLAAVNSNVVGVSHRFKDSADPTGKRVRALAAILNDTNLYKGGMLTVQLKRITNMAADANAVSVIVSSEATQSGTGMVIGKDPLQMTDNSPSSTPNGSVHIGFLPRAVAKWVSPLYDSGLCTFAARIWPNQVLSLASGLSKKAVQLVMYAFEGRSFSLLSAHGLSKHHKVAMSCLLRNMERPLGLWRLHQILSKYKWLDSAETNFIFGSSSIGTSLDAAFLASFSAAAGKKAPCSDLSDESDPEWGAWTAEHEANSPSMGVVFPTIQRVKAAKGGPCSHQGIYCFAESTWERLKTARLLHDAVPFPTSRDGIPMHVKVAQRRFQNNPGEAPYGWIYCGSHNFSPAAWGRPLAKTVHPCTCSNTPLGCTLFISNYEVGLIFVEPPLNHGLKRLKFKPLTQKCTLDEGIQDSELQEKRLGLDKFVLPFHVPAPKYEDADQPATGRAIHNAVVSWRNDQLAEESGSEDNADLELENSEAEDSLNEMQPCSESEDSNIELPADLQMEEEYGETLWSQIDTIMLA